jgi:hypothetical protein
LIVAVGIALSVPAQGEAADYFVLDVTSTPIAGRASIHASKQQRDRVKRLAPWRLSGRVVARDYYRFGDPEIFGVELSRSFTGTPDSELHAFRAAPTRTLSFDGNRGRWEATFANALVLEMDITVAGMPQPADPPLACRGTFVRVPVTLRGSFVLRTSTSFFGTVRSASLRGYITYSPAALVDCSPPPPSPTCGSAAFLGAGHRFSATSDAMLIMSSEQNGWTTLTFADRRAASSAGYTWYHVMTVPGVNPLSGRLPSISAGLPSTARIRGSGTFSARQISTEQEGPCTTTTATGDLSGTFRTRFAGWGSRSVTYASPDSASYSEER